MAKVLGHRQHAVIVDASPDDHVHLHRLQVRSAGGLYPFEHTRWIAGRSGRSLEDLRQIAEQMR